jgi:hypothetical protein
MKTDEIKLRVYKFLENTIDLYIPPIGFFDKMKNSTAKLWLEQNKWKMDKAVDSFGDENMEIDIETILKHYEQALFENGELRIDIKTMIPQQFEWVKDYLPNKIILFKKDDLNSIFN